MGHGTHVAGIARGASTGVAPEVSFLAYKVLSSSGSGSFSSVIAGIERATDPDGDPNTDDAADVINLSLGGAGDPDDPVSQAVDAATGLGVTVVISAGNSGSVYQTIGSPGVARRAITVAATTKSDVIAGFSSRGPVPGEWAMKPDISAPGVSIVSAVPAAGVLGHPSRYLSLSGTSMSAPHVAGAAALLKQLHPAWTPEMIKANLMNTALDLSYDAFTQGAGRMRVYKATQAGATLSPGSLSLGMDDLTQEIWQVDRTLTITNVSDSARTYAISVEHALPTGALATADTDSVTLTPGQSKQLLFRLSVDNGVVPNAPSEPFSFEGAVVARSGDEALRVPFAFIKSPVINFTFDENPWIVWVHDRAGKSYFNAFPGTSPQLPVSTGGTYDAVVTYRGVDTRVFKEGIVVQTGANVTVSKADAIHDVAISPVDIEGKALSIRYGGELVEHKESGLGLYFIFGFPTQRRFSNISNAYSWEWGVTRSAMSVDPVYDFNGFANDGVTGDLLFQFQPEDLKHLAFDYITPPGLENLLVRHWLSGGPVGAVSFTLYHTQETSTLKAPFVRDVYFTPNPYPDFPFGYFYEDAYPFDAATGQVLWDSQLTQTPHFAARDTTTVDAYLSGAPDDPVLTTDSSRMPVALPPPHWFGRFTNTESSIDLRASIGWQDWFFLNQMQDLTPDPDLPFELRLGTDDLIASGDLSTMGVVSAASGDYTFKATFD